MLLLRRALTLGSRPSKHTFSKPNSNIKCMFPDTKCMCFCYKSTVRPRHIMRSDVSSIPWFLSYNSWMRKDFFVKMFSVRPQILSSVKKCLRLLQNRPGASDTSIFTSWWLGLGAPGLGDDLGWGGEATRDAQGCGGTRCAPTPGIAWEGHYPNKLNCKVQ